MSALHHMGIPLWLLRNELQEDVQLIQESVVTKPELQPWKEAAPEKPGWLFMVSEQHGPQENKLMHDLGRVLGLDEIHLVIERSVHADDIINAMQMPNDKPILAMLPESVQAQLQLSQAGWHKDGRNITICNAGSVAQLLTDPLIKRALWQQLKPLL